MELIDKDALVAEIEKKKKLLPWGSCASQISMECNCKNEAYDDVISLLDTLEVKEAEKESVSKVWHDASERPDYNVGKTVIVGYNDDDDLYDECNNVAYHTTLSILVSRKDLNTRVVRWAYLKDLI